MDRRTKHLLVGSGVATVGVAAGAISHLLTGRLMQIALDRELPETRNFKRMRARLCGIVGLEEFLELRSRAGEILKNNGCKEVCIDSFDGVKLVGHWVSCANAKRVLLAMHGWRSSWTDDFGLIADFWHDSGCSVLYVEQRGQNNSGGPCMGFGLLERFDCLEWVKWIEGEIKGCLPVYLAGVSMGATTVLMASGMELPASVCGIISDCAFTSPEAIWSHVARNNLHLTYRGRRAAIESICKKRLHCGAGECSTTDALKGNRCPVLFIHGTDDHFVPVEMTYENYKICSAPKRLFVVPGADHGMSYVVDKSGYQAVMSKFWEDCERPIS